MRSQVAALNGLALVAACGCLLMLGCGSSRDLDELGVPRPPDAGVWYLDALENHPDDEGAAGSVSGSGGEAGTDATGSGATAGSGTASGSGGRGAGTGTGSGTGGRGTNNGNNGSGGRGAGSVPLPAAGTSGFPGGGGSGGFQFPGGGQGMMMTPPPPPSEDVSACSPCESLNGSLGGVPACCTDDNQCGADLSALGGSAGCVERDQPGSQSMECPEVSIMNGGFQIPGCCLPNGRCGITIMRLAPLGCIEPGVVEDLLGFDMPSGRPGRCTP